MPALLVITACAQLGEYVWVDAYREAPTPARSGYVIAPGDTLAIRVWNQEAMSGRVRVRQDGMISLPFLNDVEVAGIEPTALAKKLQAKLTDFIVNPVVTVSLEEAAPSEISIIGEVARTGTYKLEPGMGVLTTIAHAGGLTESARRDRIFVLRSTSAATPTRIRFTYEDLIRARGKAAEFRLRKGDVIVVE